MPICTRNPIVRELLRARGAELARAETLPQAAIEEAVDAGRMVLLANPAHPGVIPTLIGQPARIKVNANIGTSMLVTDVAMELDKARLAKDAGAHAIMDLSTAGDLAAIRRDILAGTDLPLGTVPLYAIAQHHLAGGGDPSDFTEDEILREIAGQAAAGVDFMTLHCGVTRRTVELAMDAGRITGIVSRGGSILGRYMQHHDRENPFLTRYDDILDICLAHNVTISLGDGMRPGCGADAGDGGQWEEVINLGRLAKRARERGVQAMIEGPGHVPLHLVQSQIQAIKRLTDGAPLYVLGPLTTDSAPGYDHIAGAIGGALAAYFGADFLCYLTPGRTPHPAESQGRLGRRHGQSGGRPERRNRPGPDLGPRHATGISPRPGPPWIGRPWPAWPSTRNWCASAGPITVTKKNAPCAAPCAPCA